MSIRPSRLPSVHASSIRPFVHHVHPRHHRVRPTARPSRPSVRTFIRPSIDNHYPFHLHPIIHLSFVIRARPSVTRPFIHLSIHPFLPIHPPIHPSISVIHPINPSVRRQNRPSAVRPSIPCITSARPSTRSFRLINPPTRFHLFIYRSTRSSIHPSIHPPVRFIRHPIHQSTHPSAYPFIYPLCFHPIRFPPRRPSIHPPICSSPAIHSAPSTHLSAHPSPRSLFLLVVTHPFIYLVCEEGTLCSIATMRVGVSTIILFDFRVWVESLLSNTSL